MMQAGTGSIQDSERTEHLGDLWYRFIVVDQGWGELGIDQAAHLPGQPGARLRIADRTFPRGLGHHAPGEIVVEVGGEYGAFEAEVGVQWQEGSPGSVEFSVVVDGESRFESGVMRDGDSPKPVRVSLEGAQELRLLVSDAGDSITCDCANWANARLFRTAVDDGEGPRGADVAPFARVMAWDPARTDGARAGRTQEFHAEDLFLGSTVAPEPGGWFSVPVFPDGRGCIGLEWLERRRLRELELRFPSPQVRPATDKVLVQAWFGPSRWQGEWKNLAGNFQVEGAQWRFRIDWKDRPETVRGTQRLRWVFPTTSSPVAIKSFSAYSLTQWQAVRLRLETVEPLPGVRGQLEIYNGELADSAFADDPRRLAWELGSALELEIRATRTGGLKCDRTVLQFHLPTGKFGVAVDDVLTHGAVYVPHAGLFVSDVTRGISFADYVARHEDQTTVLQEVRRRSDQTLSQAIDHIHNPSQNRAPTMLSLACDNNKFIVGREGGIRFQNFTATPHFGHGENGRMSRFLFRGWYPIPVVTVEDDGTVYRQRCYVAPLGDPEPPGGSPWLRDRSVLVAELSVSNASDAAADVSLSLSFEGDAEHHLPAPVMETETGFVVSAEGKACAVGNAKGAAPLRSAFADGSVEFAGSLPPQASVSLALLIPAWEMEDDDPAELLALDHLLDDTMAYWDRVMAPAMRIDVPDSLLMNVILASQVHCLIAARNEDRGARIAPWIASMSYGPLESEANSIIRGLDFIGHHEFARRALEYFIHHYSPEGFLTTGYTLMGTGWHLWTLGEHYELTRDAQWLSSVADEVSRVCEWIIRQRRKTMREDLPGGRPTEYGLMPPGVMADWNAYAFYFCLNGYYYAGLNAVNRALTAIGHPLAPVLAREAPELRSEILRAFRQTQSKMPVYLLRDGTWVPGYPSQVHCPGPTNDYFPREDANRSWAYDVELGAHHLVPLGVLDPSAPDVTWMMDHMEDVQFLADGWFDFPSERSRRDPYNLGGFAKVQPYYCRNAEVYALRDDVRPFIRSYFNTIPSLLNLENLSFQEHFNGAGAWNKTHETGYFLYQTRTMLVTERGDELWLAPFVTTNWLHDGMAVAVGNAPTFFGPVSYRISSHVGEGSISAEIDPPTRSRPRAIVIRLRHPDGKPMQKVLVNGRKHTEFDPAREIVILRDFESHLALRAEF